MVHWWVRAGIALYGVVGLIEGSSGMVEVDTQSGGSWSPRGWYDLIGGWGGGCMAGVTPAHPLPCGHSSQRSLWSHQPRHHAGHRCHLKPLYLLGSGRWCHLTGSQGGRWLWRSVEGGRLGEVAGRNRQMTDPNHVYNCYTVA
jgi:hypothetical protein